MVDADDEERKRVLCPICNAKMYFYSLDVAEYTVVPDDIYNYVDFLEEYRSITICEGCEKNLAIFLSEEPLKRYVTYYSSRNHTYVDLDEIPNKNVKELAKEVVDLSLQLFSFIFSHYETWYNIPEKTWQNISSDIKIQDGFVCIGEGFLHIFLSGKGSLHIYKEKGKYRVFMLTNNEDILNVLNDKEIIDALDKFLSIIKTEMERLKAIASLEELFG
ncbi:MAG: hypothetical protein JHC26_01855 [Thermofilum sp.]|jgi:hypothetical protein|uniref:hypothetical protein n=1 Tax=Thermofilum sp. TaxID=1961369 RepID=UPI00258B29F8|nr:hypothetical protein [Thermofilum sp.]MCI4407807.1 hypothetical protein [Thermofilum sp.]